MGTSPPGATGALRALLGSDTDRRRGRGAKPRAAAVAWHSQAGHGRTKAPSQGSAVAPTAEATALSTAGGTVLCLSIVSHYVTMGVTRGVTRCCLKLEGHTPPQSSSDCGSFWLLPSELFVPQLTFFRSVDGDLGPCDGAGLLRRHREHAWLARALHYFPGAMVELAPAPVVLGLAGMELTFPAAAHTGLFSALVRNH